MPQRRPAISVEPRPDGRWAVRKDGSRRASRVMDRKTDAVLGPPYPAALVHVERHLGARVPECRDDGVIVCRSDRPIGRRRPYEATERGTELSHVVSVVGVSRPTAPARGSSVLYAHSSGFGRRSLLLTAPG